MDDYDLSYPKVLFRKKEVLKIKKSLKSPKKWKIKENNHTYLLTLKNKR